MIRLGQVRSCYFMLIKVCQVSSGKVKLDQLSLGCFTLGQVNHGYNRLSRVIPG
jgi:hypothetical protein